VVGLAGTLWIASFAFPVVGLAELARPWFVRRRPRCCWKTLLVLLAAARW